MNRIAQIQAQRNAATRENWDLFEPHRQRVTDLLLDCAGAGNRRLCILGAGNSNDLDLARLTERFAEIYLVDLDGSALAAGARRQDLPVNAAGRLRLHGGIDVTGVAELLSGWSPNSPPCEAEFTACLSKATACNLPDLSQPFDVVASVCLLTQLVDAVVLTLGDRHPRFAELMLAIRTRHIRLLVELLEPGGIGVLVTDVVSSASCPDLGSVPSSQLGQRLRELIAANNFFHGANPFALVQRLQTDPGLAPHVGRIKLLAPWHWNLGPRSYAVCAVVFDRR